MIDFFDPNKNPFISMMNPQGPDGAQGGQSAWIPPMPWMAQGTEEAMQMMTQLFLMQMQFAQMMWMMPMHLMQGIAQMGAAAQKKNAAQPGGFQLGGMAIPPELLHKLLQMEMSPENLEKLQKVLNYLFAAIPENKDKQGCAGED